MHGDDVARLEARLLADLLAHVDGRAAEFGRRLTAWERRSHGASPSGGVTAWCASRGRAVVSKHPAVVRRDGVGQAYMQVRREQLAAVRRAASYESNP